MAMDEEMSADIEAILHTLPARMRSMRFAHVNQRIFHQSKAVFRPTSMAP